MRVEDVAEPARVRTTGDIEGHAPRLASADGTAMELLGWGRVRRVDAAALAFHDDNPSSTCALWSRSAARASGTRSASAD